MPAFRHGAPPPSGSHCALLAGRRERNGGKTETGVISVFDVGIRRNVIMRHAVIRTALIAEIERKKLFVRGRDVNEGYLAPTLRPILVTWSVVFRDGHSKADMLFRPDQVIGEGGRGGLGQDDHC